MTNPENSSENQETRDTDSWEIIETDVAGVMYDGRQVIVPRLALREEVQLSRQSDNTSDSNAIKVEKQSGEHFGYIPRELAKQIAPYMDSSGQPANARITQLISDAAGEYFRVKISIHLPRDLFIFKPAISSPELEYYYEVANSTGYVFANSSEATFSEIKKGFDWDGINFLRSGLCYRPANNGRQYQWYIKISETDTASQERIEQFFLTHFNVFSDRERAEKLEKESQDIQSQILELQKEQAGLREEAKYYESLAGNSDAESKAKQEILEKKINHLEKHVTFLQEQNNIANDQQRNLRHENDSLIMSLHHTDFDTRNEDIPDSVSDVLRNVIGESLTLSQSLKVVASIFPDRLVILETAWKSADDSRTFRDKKKAFELLWKLTTEYWSLLANGRGDVDAHRVFGDAYAAKESGPLEHNQKARSLRTFFYKDKKIEMMKHLKIGVKYSVAETLRIHFEWDADNRLIIVGHCGKHL